MPPGRIKHDHCGRSDSDGIMARSRSVIGRCFRTAHDLERTDLLDLATTEMVRSDRRDVRHFRSTLSGFRPRWRTNGLDHSARPRVFHHATVAVASVAVFAATANAQCVGVAVSTDCYAEHDASLFAGLVERIEFHANRATSSFVSFHIDENAMALERTPDRHAADSVADPSRTNSLGHDRAWLERNASRL